MNPVAADTALDPRMARTRAAILDAGAELLLEQGPDAVTPAAIAAAARVSRTTLYKHFPTRPELMCAVMVHVEPHEDFEHTGDLRADLRRLLGGLGEALDDDDRRKAMVSLLAQEQWDPDLASATSSVRGTRFDEFQVAIDEGVDAGVIRPGVDAEDAACRLFGPMLFRAVMMHRGTTQSEVDRLVDDWLASVAP
ncbi:MAG: TetR/AcrR family transcriptional regulator [Actinomycetota bacterium]